MTSDQHPSCTSQNDLINLHPHANMSGATANPNDFITALFSSLHSASPNGLGAAASATSAAPTSTAASRAPANSDPPVRGSALESAGLKPLLITLHCMFPHVLLPALDVLDRRLVVRRNLGRSSSAARPEVANAGSGVYDAAGVESGSEPGVHPNGPVPAQPGAAYYVRSSQLRRRGGGGLDGDTAAMHHEVRLRAWNCSCAGFAFAALGSDGEDAAARRRGQERESRGPNRGADGPSDASGCGDSMSPPASPRGRPRGFGGLRRTGNAPVPLCKHLLACYLLENWPMIAEAAPGLMHGDEAAGWAAGWR